MDERISGRDLCWFSRGRVYHVCSTLFSRWSMQAASAVFVQNPDRPHRFPTTPKIWKDVVWISLDFSKVVFPNRRNHCSESLRARGKKKLALCVFCRPAAGIQSHSLHLPPTCSDGKSAAYSGWGPVCHVARGEPLRRSCAR